MAQEDIFYRPDKETSALPHDPFKSFVVPRPVGWISTTSRDGKGKLSSWFIIFLDLITWELDNLAPFSQFTNVSFDPPTIL